MSLKHLLSLFFITYSFFINAQDSLYWNQFLTEQEVDSIVFYETDGKQNSNIPNKDIYDNLLSNWKKFDLSITDSLNSYYEMHTSISISDSISFHKALTIIKKDSCSLVSVSRCPPVYRDIIIFYSKKKVIYGAKICLSCKSIITSKSDNDKCLNYVINNLGLYKFYQLYPEMEDEFKEIKSR